MRTLIPYLMVLCAGVFAFDCKVQYSNYCPGALNDNCLNVDAAAKHCTSDQECAPDVCDVAGSKTCVQCTNSDHPTCVGMAPACGTNNICRACEAHAECMSNACLPDGSCGTDENVAYVDPNPGVGSAGGMPCTKTAPCQKVSDALKTGRPFVKFQGVTNDQVSLNNADVTFLADPNAKLTDMANGILIKIDGTSHISIFDLTIDGASGANNPGISLQPGNTSTVALVHVTVSNNVGGGIVASGGTLTISQSSILNNAGGGISVTNGVVDIVGNVLFNNGSNTSLVGGVSIGTTASPGNRLEFNSFALNTAQDGIASGVHCLAGNSFVAKDNIVSDNRNPTMTVQIDGTCMHAYSLVSPGALPAGVTNFGGNPGFVNEGTGDLHLKSDSPARGKADPASDLSGIAAHDIDGVARMSPADVGAYVFNPSVAGAMSALQVDGDRR